MVLTRLRQLVAEQNNLNADTRLAESACVFMNAEQPARKKKDVSLYKFRSRATVELFSNIRGSSRIRSVLRAVYIGLLYRHLLSKEKQK